ncbi:MAG TPA: hypothetical protein DCZ03_09410, partial [Gammaproteobacteria bacterium]|nr:hypothetical protein [Gammaproteobacteria bacterium]
MRFILLGAPGSGKRTQARLLTTKLSAELISPVEIAKQAAEQNDPVGLEVKALMDQAHVVPDRLYVDLITRHLHQLSQDARFFFDGFPRSVGQAQLLDEALKGSTQPIEAAIYLDVDRETLIERLTGRIICNDCGAGFNYFSAPSSLGDVCEYCGGELKRRGEEREAVIINRLKGYQGQVASVLDYYRERNLLRIINGVGDANDIFNSIASVFNLLPEALEAKDSKLTGSALIDAQRRAKIIADKKAAEAESVAQMQAKAAQQTQQEDKDAVRGRIIKPARERVPSKKGPVIKPPVERMRAKREKLTRKEVQSTDTQKKTSPKVRVEVVNIEFDSSATSAAAVKKKTAEKKSVVKKQVAKPEKKATQQKTTVSSKKSTATKGSSSKSVKPSSTKSTSTSKEAKPVKKRSTAKKKASSKKRVAAKKRVTTKKRATTKKRRAATKKRVATKKKAGTKKKRAATKKKVGTKKKRASTKKKAGT